MGIISDFFNSIDNMVIVTEADDITGEVTSQTDDIVGNNEGDAGSSDTGEIDTNTDDILGTKSEDSGNSTGDDTDTGDEDSESEDTGGDSELDDNPDENLDDSNSDDTNAGTDPENPESNDDPFMESRKRKIKRQFMHLYNVIDDNIKLITSYTPNVTDMEYIRVSSAIKDNLLQCKNTIYDLATKDFQTSDYHELLKKYVAINRIYEISIRLLEKYFENRDKDQKNKPKTNV